MNDVTATAGKLSWGTRIAYGLGDTAQNIVWGAMSILTFFYTDYAGIDPAMIGLVMLLSRCFDGFSDVLMGFIVEKTNSKWGKSRPWILWMSLPFAVSIVLIYTVPQASQAMQFAYIFVTYNFCTTFCYTALNLPYGSLSAMMTRISKERDMLSIVRMTLSPIGKILSVSATLPLIKIFGDTQLAWVKVMSIWAVLGMFLLLLCFYKCKETVVIEARKKVTKVPVMKSLKVLALNKYFWMAAFMWMMQNVIFYITGTVLPYYCKYIFHNDSLYSIMYLMETGIMIGFTILFCPKLLQKFGKRNMSLMGVSVALAGHLIYLLNPLDFNWVLFSCVIRGIGFAPLNSVIFGFLGDVVEYGQWKFHMRQEGLIFSGGSVGTKVGSGLTSAILTGLMSYAGYVSSTTANAVQPESAIQMIIDLYEIGPIFVWISIIIVLLLYRLDKLYPQIMKDLVEREAKGEL
ncbi:MAG: MFS transporter [Megasphaera sp.]|jgi:GPH family glycoside/pentoside/hexuronide:cation symporter|nr:MFS transporter [Megasphaera sp.]MCH4188501.1 MFS transporter [Megasphaera sp.]MCH4218443.1 MFS transporter [Megasphaera sp.]